MFKKKPRRPSDPFARLVRWGILLVMAYALARASWNLFAPAPEPLAAAPAATLQAKTQCAAASPSLNSGFPLLSVPVFPAFEPALRIVDSKAGEGSPAVCGQHAKLRYEYATKSGSVIFSNRDGKEKAADIIIGGNSVLPGFERGLIGMKPGGVRSITIPATLGANAVKNEQSLQDKANFKIPLTELRGQVLVAGAELESLFPPVPESPLPLRAINAYTGSGAGVQCGDTVKADISYWKLDGTKLFSTLDSTPLTFVIGQSQMPYGVEQGMLGMMMGGEREVIIPPAYTARLDSAKPSPPPFSLIPLPANEIVLAQIRLLPPDYVPAKPSSPSGK